MAALLPPPGLGPALISESGSYQRKSFAGSTTEGSLCTPVRRRSLVISLESKSFLLDCPPTHKRLPHDS